MDRITREKLKHDRLQQEFAHTVQYLSEHREKVRKYGLVAAGVLVVVLTLWGFLSYRRNVRQEDLRKATLVLDGFVGDPAQNPTGGLSFKTQAEKDAAAEKAFLEVANKYPKTREGLIARFQAATLACDQGKLADCEARFQEVAKSSDAEMASLAKLSLATLYQAQGRIPEAETLLRQLVASPTPLVSKEQAQIALAKALVRTKPQEARSIVESLKDIDRPPVSRAAVGVLGELSQR
ncbi:MAG: tetratricopeptide repeat protein [Bryobacteraceae bacterium]|nr:tetratricopeptide repeat protein [Bryobacteraceae bacterium]MDW8378588.1 tetratricopeptide repeat protein [Bryobacterales bacterium]